MIKQLIYQYCIDENSLEDRVIKDNINFSISPYLDELPDNSQKIFNSLLSKERVFTEKMMDDVIQLLSNTKRIITQRKKNIQQELANIEPPHPSRPHHPYHVLDVNYSQQLKGIEELEKIFQK